jgi:ABC-type enterochelin transport system substrate-binding protein
VVSHGSTENYWMSKRKHNETLNAIFAQRAQAGIRWGDIESRLGSMGAEISEGKGSRVRVALNGARAVFHRPHPEPTTDKGAIKSVRRFLIEAGIRPE